MISQTDIAVSLERAWREAMPDKERQGDACASTSGLLALEVSEGVQNGMIGQRLAPSRLVFFRHVWDVEQVAGFQ